MNQVIANVIHNARITTARNLLMGAGLGYCVSEEKWLHLPVVVLVPSVYAGYQLYQNRRVVASFLQRHL